MTWLFLIVGSIGCVEVFWRVSGLASVLKVKSIAARSIHTMSSRSISDHWKQKATREYARLLFIECTKISLLILVTLCPLVAAIIVGYCYEVDVLSLSMSPSGMACSIATCIAYSWFRECNAAS